MKKDDTDILKGLVAGIAGGLLASFVMEQFQVLWRKSWEAWPGPRADAQEKPPAKGQEKPATVKVADAIAKKMIGRKLRKKEQKRAGEAVHYAMGTASAALYGACAEVTPLVTAGEGLAFGAGVWLLADEVSVPALGFSKPPAEIPLSTHASAFVSHLIYGLTTELVRSAVRKAL